MLVSTFKYCVCRATERTALRVSLKTWILFASFARYLPFRVFERKLLTFTGNTSVIVLRVFLNLGNLNSLSAQSLLLEDQRGETSSEGQKLIF